MQPHNPYAPPQVAPGFGPPPPGAFGQWPTQAFMQGPALAVPRGFTFPPMCAKCGASHPQVQRPQKYQWSPPWAYALFALGWLFGLIAVLVTRKTSQHLVPLCAPCADRWKQGKLFFGLSFLPGLLFIGLAMVFAGQHSDATGILLFLSVLALVLGPIITHLVVARPRSVYPQKIDDHYTYLLGVSSQVAAAACGPALGPAQAPPMGLAQPAGPYGHPNPPYPPR